MIPIFFDCGPFQFGKDNFIIDPGTAVGDYESVPGLIEKKCSTKAEMSSSPEKHIKSVGQGMGSLHQAHVFGPVRSRRLGSSLGIDCVPFKTCNYDCFYCELGSTKTKTNLVKVYTPPQQIVEELEHHLRFVARPDYITIAGCGEPTLYKDLGELICKIKEFTNIPVALLTNGALFSRKDIRYHASQADLVIPSVDAGDERMFKCINRPHAEINFEEMVDGLYRFRQGFHGTLWIEIFMIHGLNTGNESIAGIRTIVERMAADLIHLNTVDRPPATPEAIRVPQRTMEQLAGFFGSRCSII